MASQAKDSRKHEPKNERPTGDILVRENNLSPDSVSVDERRSLDDALQIIRRHFNIQDESLLTKEGLRDYISRTRAIKQNAQPRVQLIHCVLKQMYLDPPQWIAGASFFNAAPVARVSVDNISSYLSKYPEIICIVYRNYDSFSTDPKDSDKYNQYADGQPKHHSEAIELNSKDIETAIESFLDYFEFDVARDSTKAAMLSSPYLPIFHTRGKALGGFLETLENAQRQQFQVFLDYILTEYGDEYKLVDDMTSKGKITSKYMKYLFKPGDVVVQGSDHFSRGYLCASWPQRGEPSRHELNLMVWHWEFDGTFLRHHTKLTLQTTMKDSPDKMIDDLDIRPLAYVNDPTKERLQRRGSWFWKCRIRHMVSYHEEDEQGFQNSGDGRYMIDMRMYKALHKREVEHLLSEPSGDLEPELLEQDDPPDDDFVYLTPRDIKGFSLKRKKWLDLDVDKVEPVIWNKQAFKHLVIKEKTKRLIQALVSNQIEAEKSTDLITGKGNGLVMLLHGGPGTGKTLTAESVAETAEKPLYPVTCGDIGTKPEEVERYLESVLHIGKTWGCVVLLDEADVFLEQRSLEDLHRNALVSVFLRVLEYYDGILILTSNRVGTFDEAFKSRIQLALHYKNLSKHQRTQIWGNFLSRLGEFNEDGIDFGDLKDNIEELANHKLNGREIRNVITTARQYVRWERQQPNKQHIQLDYNMMREVIETAGEFDRYIEKLNKGITYDQMAEDEGLRLGNGV
ncbi:P-loop containing nucleoside triphosphate hydrolase protein [Xylaria cubensis]|nr:P-loop containing nucleoside triphosphate hydrolase protein [Xylaria cubensis]